MTNEEAKQWFLKVYSEIKGQGYVDENEDAYELAIKALDQELCEYAYDKVLEYLKANVDDFPDYHEAIEAVLKMKGGK